VSLKQRVTDSFAERFGAPAPVLVRAPGRVNLIGEHTDYNDGFVMPMAINRAVWVALRPRPDRRVSAYSLDMERPLDFSLDEIPEERVGWGDYVKAVAWALEGAGYRLTGWEGVVSGDVPIGAGLSSSAALEMAGTRAFAAVSGFEWQPGRMARLGQKAENEWVGVNCGIMDQLISAAGVAGHAMLIDCRTLALEPVPLPAGTVVVVMDTATRRGLVDSAYNERRAQCEAAAAFFGVPALRDVSLDQFQRRAGELDEITRRRARHVVTENARTLEAAEAMRGGDAVTLGRLMNASHESLRDDFEVSSVELNEMVDCARKNAGCFGARMTGAGMGGCAVALVRADGVEGFVLAVAACYQRATKLAPNLYVCDATNGAELERLGSR
jgi:galactokinase